METVSKDYIVLKRQEQLHYERGVLEIIHPEIKKTFIKKEIESNKETTTLDLLATVEIQNVSEWIKITNYLNSALEANRRFFVFNQTTHKEPLKLCSLVAIYFHQQFDYKSLLILDDYKLLYPTSASFEEVNDYVMGREMIYRDYGFCYAIELRALLKWSGSNTTYLQNLKLLRPFTNTYFMMWQRDFQCEHLMQHTLLSTIPIIRQIDESITIVTEKMSETDLLKIIDNYKHFITIKQNAYIWNR